MMPSGIEGIKLYRGSHSTEESEITQMLLDGNLKIMGANRKLFESGCGCK